MGGRQADKMTPQRATEMELEATGNAPILGTGLIQGRLLLYRMGE